MPVMDEFRKEREALKHGTPKQKLQYFLDYYKWQTIIGLFVLVFVIWIIHDMTSQKDHVFFASFLNAYNMDRENVILTDFEALLEIDPSKESTEIDTSMSISENGMDETSYTSVQKLMVLMAAQELDIIAADQETFGNYASTEYFYDLRELLSPEQLKVCEPLLYYADMEEVRKRNAAREAADYDYEMPRLDPFAPEQMKDPVPVGICIQDAPKIKGHYYFQSEKAPMGFVINSRHSENALLFLEYIMSE